MIRIKRTKRSPDPEVKELAVHFATSVAKEGNVTGWTPNREEAGTFDDALMPKIKAHYAKRPLAGELKFEPVTKPKVEPKAEPAAGSSAEPKPAASAE